MGSRKEEQTPMQAATAAMVMVSIMVCSIAVAIIAGSLAAWVVLAIFGA